MAGYRGKTNQEYQREYYLKNREHRLNNMKDYYLNNREYLLLYSNEYNKNRRINKKGRGGKNINGSEDLSKYLSDK